MGLDVWKGTEPDLNHWLHFKIAFRAGKALKPMALSGKTKRLDGWNYLPGARLDWKNSNLMNSIIFVLFDKYYPIIDQLGSKDSSRDF
jgi:hypothetical protein